MAGTKKPANYEVTEPSSASQWARGRVARNRRNEPTGFFSVCSAHPTVLDAAIRQAVDDGSHLCVESTSNQVNQFGGYTGETPADFAKRLFTAAEALGLPAHRLLLGGDHLGPYPWRKQPSAVAIENGCRLVRDCVLAGYQKIHLDASMSCADDPPVLSDDVVAERAAQLCLAAEQACAESGRSRESLMYVIGTEVPVPGGEQAQTPELRVTEVAAARNTLEVTRRSFVQRGLESAWERVIGLVVQPGVEFGDASVHEYNPGAAHSLAEALPASPELVYEAHSTDYQTLEALRNLVRDHFGILKVGPWLTFAMREAIFALSEIEKTWLGNRAGVRLSNVSGALESAMLRNPEHWKPYYSGADSEIAFKRRFSFSDRCRYYWPDVSVQRELDQLFANLTGSPIPLTLLSQFLPRQYEKVRRDELTPAPESLVRDSVGDVLRIYAAATQNSSG